MAQSPNYRALAAQKARQYGIDPSIFQAQIQQESGFNPAARSGAGAIGIAQIVPRWHPGVNPSDPVASLDYAAKWDSQLLKKYGGDWKQTLSVYNSGQPDKYADPAFSGGQTYNYVRAILGGQHPSAPAASAQPPAQTVQQPTPAPRSQLASALGVGPQRTQDSPPVDQTAIRRQFATALLGSLKNGQITDNAGLASALQQRRSALTAPAPQQQQQPMVTPPPQPPPQQPAAPTLPNALSQPSGPSAPGSPIPAKFLTSVGGEHETAGLPGYPAHDYMAPAGSPVTAPVGGTIVRFSGHDPAGGPTDGVHGPFGWSEYLKGDDGRLYYLTHLGSRTVKVGQRVDAGALLGTVGDYAHWGGANHVHEGVSG